MTETTPTDPGTATYVQNERPASLFIRRSQHLYRLNYEDIIFVRSDGNYSFLQTRSGTEHAVKMSLRKLQTVLPACRFFRIHKSYLIHLDHLDEVDLQERKAIVQREVIPIGRTFMQALTATLRII